VARAFCPWEIAGGTPIPLVTGRFQHGLNTRRKPLTTPKLLK
jgi:hypothetical protein